MIKDLSRKLVLYVEVMNNTTTCSLFPKSGFNTPSESHWFKASHTACTE